MTYRYQELDHIYTRLASRLNVYLNGHNLFEELRNKGFQLHDPEGYQRTSEVRKKTWGLSYPEIKQEILSMLEQNEMDVKVEGRVKTTFSLHEKVHSRRRPEIKAFEEITDMVGARVIAEDIDRALGLIYSWLDHQKIPFRREIKDKWKKGYEAFHINFGIKFEQGLIPLSYEIMVMHPGEWVKYISGLQQEKFLPVPKPHWIYKAVGLDVIGSEQIFESDKIDLGVDFQGNYRRLYESLQDKAFIMYLTADMLGRRKMQVIDLPKGSFAIDLAGLPALNKLSADYRGFFKIKIGKIGEEISKELARSPWEETEPLRTGAVLMLNMDADPVGWGVYEEMAG